MCFEVELEELEPQRAIVGGESGPNRPQMDTLVLERKGEMN